MHPTLITEKRLRDSNSPYNDLSVSCLSDRSRFIYSAAFRRLQMKAQVFSLESNASVRSRFSHSAEVAHIGIFIVTKIIELLKKNEKLIQNEALNFLLNNQLPFLHTVETACLIHDVGNPPFGHFGEAAITKWFSDNKSFLYSNFIAENNEISEISETQFNEETNFSDFLHFDGNPQGFRIISHLQGFDEQGLNLSLSLLASTLKYVSDNKEVDPNSDITKKMGYFSTEKNIINSIKKELSLGDKSRHPLVYLMEAADDISYCISDIEDAIEKNICSYRDFFEFFKKNFISIIDEIHNRNGDNKFINKAEERLNDAIEIIKNDNATPINLPEKFMLFKTSITNFCVEEVSSIYINNIDKYLNGKEGSVIKEGTSTHQIQEIFKEFTKRYVFTSDEAELIELSGYAVIYGLLDKFKPILVLSVNDFEDLISNKNIKRKKLDLHKRLFNRLPSKHVNCYNLAVKNLDKTTPAYLTTEYNLRCHLIIDYIAGMTDSFALEVYQALEGIKVKHDGC